MLKLDPLNKKGQQVSKVVFGTAISLAVLIFGFFAILLGITTLNPSSFFTANSLEANATTEIQSNLTTGIANFSQQIPRIFTILGVVMIIVALVLLIAFVKRMDSAGGGGSSSL